MRLSILALLAIFCAGIYGSSMPVRWIAVEIGQNLEIPFYQPKKIDRWITNAKGVEIHQVFRVCNGKNKKTCGYWENTKTKKKVGRVTTYNKKKDALIMKKLTAADIGTYRNVASYDTVYLMQPQA